MDRPENFADLLQQRRAEMVAAQRARAESFPETERPEVLHGEIVQEGPFYPEFLPQPETPPHQKRRDETKPFIKYDYPIGSQETGDTHPFPEWGPAFLADYRNNGVLTPACMTAHVRRKTFQRYYDGNRSFREACDEAKSESIDMLEAHARLRATVYNSDRVLIRLLESERPEKFAPHRVGAYHMRRQAQEELNASHQQRLADNRSSIFGRLTELADARASANVSSESDV